MATINEAALRWAERAVDATGEANITQLHELKGGISTPIHRVTMEVSGEIQQYVLRQYTNEEWLRIEPDLAKHEAASLLRASTALGALIPDVLAFDETGEACGVPTVMMTHVAGRVVLDPEDIAAWTDNMANVLAKLHCHGVAEEFPWRYRAYSNAAEFGAASWSAHPEAWQRAVSIVTGEAPAYVPLFIHRDFHPANLLWTNGRVSGVVDWVNGCIGPAGIDVGHCRVNLAQLHGVEVADAFLESYRLYAGESFRYDPYWDLVTLLDYADGTPEVYQGWIDLGFEGLTDEVIRERLDQYLKSLLARTVQ